MLDLVSGWGLVTKSLSRPDSRVGFEANIGKEQVRNYIDKFDVFHQAVPT